MQVVVNDSYVRSRTKIGNTAHIISLVLLGVGFVLSLLGPNYGPEAIFGAYIAMAAALVLLSYGRTFTRRWGSRFRQDVLLVPNMKGLDTSHTLFNYPGPGLPDHILVGPTGLYVLVPKPNSGLIRFDGRRWSRGGAGATLIRNMTQGAMGNPIDDVRRAMGQLATYLKKNGPEELIQGLEARPIIVFTNPGARLEITNSQVPVITLRDLRGYFRRAKSSLEPEKVAELKRVLGQEEAGA